MLWFFNLFPQLKVYIYAATSYICCYCITSYSFTFKIRIWIQLSKLKLGLACIEAEKCKHQDDVKRWYHLSPPIGSPEPLALSCSYCVYCMCFPWLLYSYSYAKLSFSLSFVYAVSFLYNAHVLASKRLLLYTLFVLLKSSYHNAEELPTI